MAHPPRTKADGGSDGPLNETLDTSGLDAILSANKVLSGAFSDLGAEFWTFLSNRLAEDMKFQKEILSCRDWKQMGALQTEFFMQAFEHYNEEARRMIEMGTGMAEKLLRQDGPGQDT